MAFVGDLGGVHELFYAATSTLAGYYSFHSFMLKALKKMYLGSTNDFHLFLKKKPKYGKFFKTLKAKVPRDLDDDTYKHHYPIKLSLCNNIRVFWLNRFCCLCCCKRGRNARLMRLFKEGEDRLNNDFSIDKIVKYLKNIKILTKHSILTEEMSFNIEHHPNNIIECDRGAIKKNKTFFCN